MAWVNWSRKQTAREGGRSGRMLGVDLTATRLRAAGTGNQRLRTVALDDTDAELPLAISMEGRTAEVGRAALDLTRRLPHALCAGYLGHLGKIKQWKAGRHQLDADAALTLAFERLRPIAAGFDSLLLAVPGYLSNAQVGRIAAIARRQKLPLITTINAALALAADRARDLFRGHSSELKPSQDGVVPMFRNRPISEGSSVLIIDADDYALTGSLVHVTGNDASIICSESLPLAGLLVWKDRLLNAICDRCIRVCRRDPRDSAEAEQALYEQINQSLDFIREGKKVTISVRSAHWYQDLALTPEDFANACLPQIKLSVEAMHSLLSSHHVVEPPCALWLTHEAGRLPGLWEMLHHHMAERTNVEVLPEEAVSFAAAHLLETLPASVLNKGPLEKTIPLPAPTIVATPARPRLAGRGE